jgi:hypothetical protein
MIKHSWWPLPNWVQTTLDTLTVLFLHWRPIEYPPIFHWSYFTLYCMSMHTLYCACARCTAHAHNHFRLGQPHFFGRSGRAYSTHSTAETVNSEVFQDANRVKQLMECKKANDECVYFQFSYQGVISIIPFKNLVPLKNIPTVILLC